MSVSVSVLCYNNDITSVAGLVISQIQDCFCLHYAGKLLICDSVQSVSYTHLDVYKRQVLSLVLMTALL